MGSGFTGLDTVKADSAIAQLESIALGLDDLVGRVSAALERVGCAGDHAATIASFEPIRNNSTDASTVLRRTLIGMQAAAAGLSFGQTQAQYQVLPFPAAPLPMEVDEAAIEEILEIIDKGDDLSISNGELNKIRELLAKMTPEDREALLDRMTDEQLERLFWNVHSSGTWSNDWDDRERYDFYVLFDGISAEKADEIVGRLPEKLQSPVGNWFTLTRSERVPLGDIINQYQVEDDEMKKWRPWWAPAGSEEMTKKEADLLADLGMLEMIDFVDIRSNSFDTADDYYPPDEQGGRNFNHNDAFRHTYWSAQLAARYGPEWALAFTQAHEGLPGNPAAVEAQDLHNNELGIRIAMQNPGASPEELAKLVDEAVKNGDAVVIDKNGNLAYSDDVPIGERGLPRDEQKPGKPPAELEEIES